MVKVSQELFIWVEQQLTTIFMGNRRKLAHDIMKMLGQNLEIVRLREFCTVHLNPLLGDRTDRFVNDLFLTIQNGGNNTSSVKSDMPWINEMGERKLVGDMLLLVKDLSSESNNADHNDMSGRCQKGIATLVHTMKCHTERNIKFSSESAMLYATLLCDIWSDSFPIITQPQKQEFVNLLNRRMTLIPPEEFTCSWVVGMFNQLQSFFRIQEDHPLKSNILNQLGRAVYFMEGVFTPLQLAEVYKGFCNVEYITPHVPKVLNQIGKKYPTRPCTIREVVDITRGISQFLENLTRCTVLYDEEDGVSSAVADLGLVAVEVQQLIVFFSTTIDRCRVIDIDMLDIRELLDKIFMLLYGPFPFLRHSCCKLFTSLNYMCTGFVTFECDKTLLPNQRNIFYPDTIQHLEVLQSLCSIHVVEQLSNAARWEVSKYITFFTTQIETVHGNMLIQQEKIRDQPKSKLNIKPANRRGVVRIPTPVEVALTPYPIPSVEVFVLALNAFPPISWNTTDSCDNTIELTEESDDDNDLFVLLNALLGYYLSCYPDVHSVKLSLHSTRDSNAGFLISWSHIVAISNLLFFTRLIPDGNADALNKKYALVNLLTCLVSTLPYPRIEPGDLVSSAVFFRDSNANINLICAVMLQINGGVVPAVTLGPLVDQSLSEIYSLFIQYELADLNNDYTDVTVVADCVVGLYQALVYVLSTLPTLQPMSDGGVLQQKVINASKDDSVVYAMCFELCLSRIDVHSLSFTQVLTLLIGLCSGKSKQWSYSVAPFRSVVYFLCERLSLYVSHEKNTFLEVLYFPGWDDSVLVVCLDIVIRHICDNTTMREQMQQNLNGCVDPNSLEGNMMRHIMSIQQYKLLCFLLSWFQFRAEVCRNEPVPYITAKLVLRALQTICQIVHSHPMGVWCFHSLYNEEIKNGMDQGKSQGNCFVQLFNTFVEQIPNIPLTCSQCSLLLYVVSPLSSSWSFVKNFFGLLSTQLRRNEDDSIYWEWSLVDVTLALFSLRNLRCDLRGGTYSSISNRFLYRLISSMRRTYFYSNDIPSLYLKMILFGCQGMSLMAKNIKDDRGVKAVLDFIMDKLLPNASSAINNTCVDAECYACGLYSLGRFSDETYNVLSTFDRLSVGGDCSPTAASNVPISSLQKLRNFLFEKGKVAVSSQRFENWANVNVDHAATSAQGILNVSGVYSTLSTHHQYQDGNCEYEECESKEILSATNNIATVGSSATPLAPKLSKSLVNAGCAQPPVGWSMEETVSAFYGLIRSCNTPSEDVARSVAVVVSKHIPLLTLKQLHKCVVVMCELKRQENEYKFRFWRELTALQCNLVKCIRNRFDACVNNSIEQQIQLTETIATDSTPPLNLLLLQLCREPNLLLIIESVMISRAPLSFIEELLPLNVRLLSEGCCLALPSSVWCQVLLLCECNDEGSGLVPWLCVLQQQCANFVSQLLLDANSVVGSCGNDSWMKLRVCGLLYGCPVTLYVPIPLAAISTMENSTCTSTPSVAIDTPQSSNRRKNAAVGLAVFITSIHSRDQPFYVMKQKNIQRYFKSKGVVYEVIYIEDCVDRTENDDVFLSSSSNPSPTATHPMLRQCFLRLQKLLLLHKVFQQDVPNPPVH